MFEGGLSGRPQCAVAAGSSWLTKHRASLKAVMLGLVYPAILGSVFYVALQLILTPLVAHLAASWGLEVAVDESITGFQWLKIGLMVITTIFYHCDYFYIQYTNDFGVAFFVADCFFILTLYATLIAVNPLSATEAAVPLVACAFLAFFFLYLFWDLYERFRCEPAERPFYDVVLAWEAASIVAISLNLSGEGCAAGNTALLVITGASTLAFGALVLWKKRFFHRGP